MLGISRLGATLAIGLAVVGSNGVSAKTFHTSAWFLGDSLSDPGNLYALTGGGLPPSPPYFEGRSSNGPVWAEHIARDFADKGLPTANFAYAYATAVTNDDLAIGRPVQIPDLPRQIELFTESSAGALGARPLVSMLFGANDIFGAVSAAAFDTSPQAAAQRVAVAAQNAAKSILNGIESLVGFGVEDFLVFTLPALDKTPAFNLLQPSAAPLAKLGTDVFNDTLIAGLGGLSGQPDVAVIDLFDIFNLLIANPQEFGVADATMPCVIPEHSVCAPDVADRLAFFDPVHPNQIVHARVAEIVRGYVAPVPLPLPSLLLAGGLGAILVSRRRPQG